MNRPNLFEIGTKELAQDAFLTWLISYADNQYIEHKELNTLAKDFIKMMISNNNLNIEKVYCWRQWEKIDISVTVNDKYFIIIEDKTGTNQHGNQLANYKEKAQNYCNENNLELVCVFLKTRDDSTYIINSVEREGYKYISRNDLLSLFEKHSHIKNDILLDYIERLKNIEAKTNSYKTDLLSIKDSYDACCGFYKELEKRISKRLKDKSMENALCNWEQVNNPGGMFLGFWFYPANYHKSNMYFQIENYFDKRNNIRVLIKTESKDRNEINKLLETAYKTGEKYNINIEKVSRLKIHTWTPIAYIKNDIFSGTYEECLDSIEHILDMFDDFSA